jgi:hypothetical protein
VYNKLSHLFDSHFIFPNGFETVSSGRPVESIHFVCVAQVKEDIDENGTGLNIGWVLDIEN